MKRIHLAFVSSCVVSLVAGCGGGSDATTGTTTIPTAAVQITPTNAPSVAKGAVTPAQGMAKTGSGMAGVVGVVAQTSGRSRSVLDISLAKFAQVRGLQLAPAAGVAGVIAGFPITVPCATSGTMSMDIQDGGISGTVGVGDVFVMSFSNCSDGISTENGSMAFAITGLNGGVMGGTGTPTTPLTASFTLTFNNFSSRDIASNLTDAINGDISFSTTDDGTNTTGTMSGTSLRMDSSVDGAFLMTNYNFTFMEANVPTATTPYSFRVNMTIASTVANGSVTVTTPVTFAGQGVDDPTAGQMLITGANGSTLTLTASPDGVTVQMVVDEDGAGATAPVGLADTTWAAI